MTVNSIPNPAEPIVGGQRLNLTWYKYLRELDAAARQSGLDLTAAIEEISRRLGSTDGSPATIPESVGSQLVGLSPVVVAGSSVTLEAVAETLAGEIQAIEVDGFGRVVARRPVVAGAGIEIDGETDPERVELRAKGQINRITTDGDFRRTTQNDLRETA